MSTFVFIPEPDAWGPTNNLVGIADVLRRRGHRCVFAITESFKGEIEKAGLEERHLRTTPPAESEEGVGQFWVDFVAETAPIFRKPTLEQLGEFIAPTWQALADGIAYGNARALEILEEVRPDVVVEDCVSSWPAVQTFGAPWVRIVSCNPLEMQDPDLPPVFSGYAAGDSAGWEEFRREYRRRCMDAWRGFDELHREQGSPPLGELEFQHVSPHANVYVYPAEADYARAQPLGSEWHRVDSCVRATDAPFERPATLAEGGGKLVYLSLGSLGSADVELMQHLLDALGKTPHRILVSLGPRADELRLPANAAGASFLPQVSLMPEIDLVLTHGGNNTFCECFHFGKPMIVLPVFWDQYDNAQRADETGFGIRLDTYRFEDEELAQAVDRLLLDEGLHARLAPISARLQANPGAERIADLVEKAGG
ncbi:MAG TPA: nucleotide disphospho-sugar-binding domain-containing protein [Gaiellaceae bacterium]